MKEDKSASIYMKPLNSNKKSLSPIRGNVYPLGARPKGVITGNKGLANLFQKNNDSARFTPAPLHEPPANSS